jgi:hypothetical protein
MSTSIPSRPVPDLARRESPWMNGLSIFAGSLMLIVGVWQVLVGISALLRDTVYVTTPNYIYSFDLTGWGWTHLLLGILIGVAGAGVLLGQTWARVVGIVLASLSLISNFLFLPYYPLWSILVIVLDIAIIWALAVYRRQPAV